MPARNIEMLQIISNGLGDLVHKAVFVGGSILDLYITDGAAPENHPTGEVDVIISVPSMFEYYEWEKAIEVRGFEKLGPLANGNGAQWKFGGARMNTVPMYADITGFRNRWYEEGIFHAQSFQLPNENAIRIFSPAYFIASKIEAYRNRGNNDFRMSEDFEDIVYMLDNRAEVKTDIFNSFYEVRNYIQLHFREFLSSIELEEGIYNVLPIGAEEQEVQKILEIMKEVSAYEPTYI